MDLVQEVRAQIEASKLGDLRGLLNDLEAHRRALRGTRGFVDMQITRATEAGGNVMLDVRTRWSDNNSLADYSGAPESVTSIIERHGDLVIPGTLDVRRVEAVDEDRGTDAREVYDRFGIALFLPLAIVAIGLTFIYGLSRVYLELDNKDGAAILAGLVPITILLGAWFFASGDTPSWQYAIAGVAILAFLLGGTVYAQVHEGPNIGEEHVEASPTPGGAEPPPGGPPMIQTHDNFFTASNAGGDNPSIPVPGAGTLVTLPIQNEGKALHNMHIESAPGAGFAVSFCTPGGDAPCSDPARIRAGTEASISFTLPAGIYAYRCDFHTTEMQGTITVQ